MPRHTIYLADSEEEAVNEHAEHVGSRSGVLRKALDFWLTFGEGDSQQHVCWECERAFSAADDAMFCPYCAGTQTETMSEEVDV